MSFPFVLMPAASRASMHCSSMPSLTPPLCHKSTNAAGTFCVHGQYKTQVLTCTTSGVAVPQYAMPFSCPLNFFRAFSTAGSLDASPTTKRTSLHSIIMQHTQATAWQYQQHNRDGDSDLTLLQDEVSALWTMHLPVDYMYQLQPSRSQPLVQPTAGAPLQDMQQLADIVPEP